MTAPCRIDGCEKPGTRRKLCNAHYLRWQKYGDPLGHGIRRSKYASPEQRFWVMVDFSGVCWEWTGSAKLGYGHFNVDGTFKRAHRLVWEWLVGPIPDGLELDHLCKNPPCVNPDHLEPVTRAENNRRSNSLSARRARQTHCKRGHEFTPENTKRDKKSRRICRECNRAKKRRHYYASKERAA